MPRELYEFSPRHRSPLGNPVRLAIALYLLPRQGAYFAIVAGAQDSPRATRGTT